MNLRLLTLTRRFVPGLLAVIVLLSPSLCMARQGEFMFGVISLAGSAGQGDAALRIAIEDTDNENHAFVVANGIKDASEPCNDALYQRRIALLKSAKNGLIVSMAASDWAECKTNGKSTALGKLSRLRELLYEDDFSMGSSRIPLVRQSATIKFRNFPENARWEIEDVMFATLNLPANNNHYVPDAGRNSEFEDRLVANRDWLRRIFLHASKKKVRGIVVFCDGNPLAVPAAGKRDGYVEIRRQLTLLAKEFRGKVLLVSGQPPAQAQGQARMASEIAWQGNIGELSPENGLLRIAVNPAVSELFSVLPEAPQTVSRR
jgi:hypothetical protein